MREPRDPLLKVVSVLWAERRPLSHSRNRVCEDRGFGRARATPSAAKGAQCGFANFFRGEAGPARRPEPERGLPEPPRGDALMILPQVHLRKPCYDFYFL